VASALPVAVPDKIIGLTLFLDFIDRSHSLGSLLPPQAAFPSLPKLSHIREETAKRHSIVGRTYYTRFFLKKQS